MAEVNKTQETTASVEAFIAKVADATRREEARTILALMRRATGLEPKLWGTALIGFGRYHYRYATGREGDMPLAAFSPRKKEITVYVMSGTRSQAALLKRLGRHRIGGACLYLPALGDIDLGVLEQIVKRSAAMTQRMWADSATQKGPTLSAKEKRVAAAMRAEQLEARAGASATAKRKTAGAARGRAAARVSRSTATRAKAKRAARRTA